jgi:hypothetical protein
MENRDELLKLLQLSQEIRHYNHQALWEEEKHFTWWISIVFSTLIFVYLNSNLLVWQKVFIINLGCIFGFLVSLLGYRVIRKESIYFKDAIETFSRICRALELHKINKESQNSEWNLPLMPEYPVSENFQDARKNVNKPLHHLLLGLFRSNTLSIRDCFQLIFIIFWFIFIGFYVFTWITFWDKI